MLTMGNAKGKDTVWCLNATDGRVLPTIVRSIHVTMKEGRAAHQRFMVALYIHSAKKGIPFASTSKLER